MTMSTATASECRVVSQLVPITARAPTITTAMAASVQPAAGGRVPAGVPDMADVQGQVQGGGRHGRGGVAGAGCPAGGDTGQLEQGEHDAAGHRPAAASRRKRPDR
jgi:hypothetical protein